jgi:hypothetical protein
VEWLGISSSSADELLAGSASMAPSQQDQSATFLQDFLSAGARTAREIWEAAQKGDHSERIHWRAKHTLNIRTRRVYIDKRPVSYWLLPGQELPDSLADYRDFDRYIAEMEKQFPQRTPLDREEGQDDAW